MKKKKKVEGLIRPRRGGKAATLSGTDEASLHPKVVQDEGIELKGVRCRSS